jgi:hypothetical protein
MEGTQEERRNRMKKTGTRADAAKKKVEKKEEEDWHDEPEKLSVAQLERRERTRSLSAKRESMNLTRINTMDESNEVFETPSSVFVLDAATNDIWRVHT